MAFTGLAGCGASELMQAMFGALPSTGGSMRVNGRGMEGSIVRFMKTVWLCSPPTGRRTPWCPT